MERRKYLIGSPLLFSFLALLTGVLPAKAGAGPKPCDPVKAAAIPVCEAPKKIATPKPCEPVKAKPAPCAPAKKVAAVKACDPAKEQCQHAAPRGPVSHLTKLVGLLFHDRATETTYYVAPPSEAPAPAPPIKAPAAPLPPPPKAPTTSVES